MVKKRLSSVLSAIRRGFAVDTFEGGFPLTQIVKAVGAASTTAVHAAVTLTTAAQDVTSAITSPDVYRGVSVSGNQSNVYANVIVYGMDWADRPISETILASGTTTGFSNQAFKTVTKIRFPVRTNTGQTVAVGIGTKLGLVRPISATADVVQIERAASGATSYTLDGTTGTIDATYGTVIPSGGITAADSFKINFRTTVF